MGGQGHRITGTIKGERLKSLGLTDLPSQYSLFLVPFPPGALFCFSFPHLLPFCKAPRTGPLVGAVTDLYTLS